MQMMRHIGLAGGLFICLALAGCGETRSQITDDVLFVDLSGRTSAIFGPNDEILVYPNVVEHRVVGDFIIGKREMAEDNTDGSDPFTKGLGYFKFDLRAKTLEQGLSKEWCAADKNCRELL